MCFSISDTWTPTFCIYMYIYRYVFCLVPSNSFFHKENPCLYISVVTFDSLYKRLCYNMYKTYFVINKAAIKLCIELIFRFLIRLAMLEIMMFWGMTYIDTAAYRGSTKKGPYPDSSNCCRPLYSFWLLMWRSDQYSCRYHILSPGNSNMLYVRIKRINALFLYPVLVAPDHRFHPGRYPKTQNGFLHDSS